MDTAMVGSRPTVSVLTNSSGPRRSSRVEAKAAARSLVEWAGDDPTAKTRTPRQEFLPMIGSHGNAPHES